MNEASARPLLFILLGQARTELSKAKNEAEKQRIDYQNYYAESFSDWNSWLEFVMSEVSEMVPGGHRPVQIVKIDDDSETHNFILDEEALNEILNKDNIRDKPVCILSVAGGSLTSRGPSLLVNYPRKLAID